MFNLNSEAFLTLLKAFVPYDWVQWAINISVFVIIPAIIIYFSIQVAKKIYEPKAVGAWRTAGNFWCNLMAINLAFVIGFFCLTVYWAGNHSSFNSKYEGIYRKNFLVNSTELNKYNRVSETDLINYAKNHAGNKYKVDARRLVKFFHDDYAIIHYFPWLAFDTLVVIWLFLPGVTMRKQRIKF